MLFNVHIHLDIFFLIMILSSFAFYLSQDLKPSNVAVNEDCELRVRPTFSLNLQIPHFHLGLLPVKAGKQASFSTGLQWKQLHCILPSLFLFQLVIFFHLLSLSLLSPVYTKDSWQNKMVAGKVAPR